MVREFKASWEKWNLQKNLGLKLNLALPRFSGKVILFLNYIALADFLM